MSTSSSLRHRLIAGLVALVVLVFGAILYTTYNGLGLFGSSDASSTNSVASTGAEPDTSGFPIIDMKLETGTVSILLRPDLAPNHVQRIIDLSESGFYDGVPFHRVIEGFMAQTGDPTGTGTGGSDLPDLEPEFNDRAFERGTLGMARSRALNSANSQFFIVYDSAPHLNGQYTLFGKVIAGMDLIDGLKKGSPSNNGLVENPDHVISMRLRKSE